MNRAPGQQLDLFSPTAAPADPAAPGLVDLHRVLSGMSAHPECGCVTGYVQRSGPHVGLWCSAHGKWLGWLDAAGRERAKAAGGEP